MVTRQGLSTFLSRPWLRLFSFVGLVALELALLSIRFDAADLTAGYLPRLVNQWGAVSLRFGIAAAALILLLSRSALETALSSLGRFPPISVALVTGHALLLLLSWFLALRVFGHAMEASRADWLAGAWILTGVLAMVCAGLAFFPARVWVHLFASCRDVLIFAIAAALAGTWVGGFARNLWRPLSSLTFSVVSSLLKPWIPGLLIDPSHLTLAARGFDIEIADECSGLEGIGLVLAFSSAWLWFSRRDYRFPRALLLLPVGVVVIWAMNAARIAALFALGYAGAPGIALGGFHSQAGWISFILIATVCVAGSSRVAWLRREKPRREVSLDGAPPGNAAAARNFTAVYLVPFLAILAAAMVSKAASAKFEWLYPLRPLAALVAFACYREPYRQMNWRVSWLGAVAGVAVFALWIGLEPAGAHAAAPSHVPAAWIAARVFAAAITVPIAEELAFRGFLLRRLAREAFETVDPRSAGLLAVVLSSLVFGLFHGDRWLAGSLAGLVYAGVYCRRGSIGDAALAHGLTNALLAVYVLTTGNWQLW
ncbi:MAG: exosortase E/protease, VPEID-CTERM system [Bryobacteraceae bacterium]|jgi:exosortase E/protease (VPEID-CTERM system)